jgi:hypothetical protein
LGIKKSLNFSWKKVDTHGNKPYFYIIIKKERDMKKAAKVEYGIQIVKPWSNEMYDHNDAVADAVRDKVFALWNEAVESTAFALGVSVLELSEFDWDQASGAMEGIQKAVTLYGIGCGYSIARIDNIVTQEIEEAPYYRLNEMVEELELELEKGFVGF